MNRILVVLVMLLVLPAVVRAEILTAQMMFYSEDGKVIGLKTPTGLVAVNYGPDLRITGIASLNLLKPCDEVAVDVASGGLSLVTSSLEFKKRDEGKSCPPLVALSVPVAEFYQALEKKTAVVIDVRSAGEYNKLHFDGAVNIPLGEIEARSGEIPRDKPVLIYCSTARRSVLASLMLREKGIETKIVMGKFVVKDGKPSIAE